MKTSVRGLVLRSLLGAGVILSICAGSTNLASAQDVRSLTDYVAKNHPPLFDDPSAAVEAFKSVMAKDDFDGLAALLGLNGAKLRTSEGVMDTYAQIRQGAGKSVTVHDLGDRKELDIGDELWPLPFPITKGKDGKWAFDTRAGIEEIINRRVGENELTAIETVRAYVDAQRDYAAEDRDGDGVLEYAQKLISSDGKADGLYWPSNETNGVSPAGDFIIQAALDKAKKGNGYFGYRFRILTGQGKNIAGGAYNYIINGNMIAGFALVAWPVKYAETGVKTFVVNQQDIVYEADLGPNTEAAAGRITLFNPDDKWQVTGD
ncbi:MULTISPECIES: DUF2950 domain-containing protein [unclassified Mesorhizobium]|uniref:DUF2950 domain-containing protein n=2 Tax=Mesorhizobium TaxID=68287 RepID=UPI000FCC5C79|nr:MULTISPECIES: DUF2950 domain-containing protein [unclassified Mesorhizobium]TGP24901.1 DUF2950 family protein [Mesorhizobium sp. M1D.F.Ca.ET.231.01.1.1]TGP36223.1 DUF2950 family protein [Mesorhizobium sp. M1D.F.Ca.ET.234.01.1.1]TGS49726.1 DUF2950 family protein [Mesorhizobium sp. M1D.F.Ca.ET.184.01.1.1]TGS64437.1 DUF2950 family protein [Mesorhizobium sp. M1D.F.Ca.ET.183.01.1.1]